MLTIFGRADSSNVQAVMWCIGELSLPYERQDFGHRYGGTDSAEFRAMNPNGLVPVLKDGDGPAIFEAAAILRYLANRYESEEFWPADPMLRAGVDTWAEWVKTTLCPRFTGPIFWRLERTAPSKRDPEAISNAVAEFEDKLQIAEDRLGQHAWLAGEDFTLADIQLGHILYRYHEMPIDRKSLPHINRYYETLKQRPAYSEHVMVSWDALRATD